MMIISPGAAFLTLDYLRDKVNVLGILPSLS